MTNREQQAGNWTAVYVSCAGDRRIAIFAMGRETGALEPVGGAEVPGQDEDAPISMPLAMSPDRRFLYAAVRTPPFCVSSFAIDGRSGALTLLGTADLPDSMAYIVTDATGRHLLSASYQGGRIASHRIGADGAVQSPATQVLNVKPKAHCILPDPSGRHVHVPCLGGDVVLQLRFDPGSGTLAAETSVRTEAGAGPRHLVFHPNGRFAYLANELNGSVNAYSVDGATGNLQELQSLSLMPSGFTGSAAAADIHVTPDGRWLYASERKTNTLSGFGVDPSSGMLSPIGTVPAEDSPRGFAMDPRGRFLLCAGQVTQHVAVYAIDPQSGRLTGSGRHHAGPNANWIEIVDLPGR